MVTRASTESKSTKTNSVKKGRSNTKIASQVRKKQPPKKQVSEARVVQNSSESVTYPRTLAIVALVIEAVITTFLIIPALDTRVYGILLFILLALPILMILIVSLLTSGRVSKPYQGNTRVLAILGIIIAVTTFLLLGVSAPFALTVNCLCLFVAFFSTLSFKSDIAEE